MKNLIRKILREYEDSESIYNFLRRRVVITDISKYGLTIIKYTFEGFPGFGFNSFSSRKEVEKKIINFLYDIDIIDDGLYDSYYSQKNNLNPELQSVVRSIRKFLNFINY